MMCNFQVGFCKKDITPPLGTLLMGYPRDRVSNKVLDNLYANAIAMKQGDTVAILIGLDLALITVENSTAIRNQIAQELGISADGISIFAIHTHSGPIVTTTPGWGDSNDEYLLGTMAPNAVAAAKEAYANIKPAQVAVGTAQSYAAVNRRQIKDGQVILGQNPDGPFDPTMTVVRFQTLEGAPICSFVHYACHPTAAGSNWSITRDWPGVVVDRLEEISGAPCLYMNGAQGDVGPRLSNGDTGGYTEDALYEIGFIAREDAQKAYEAATEFSVPQLKVFAGQIPLPYNPAPTLEQVQAQIDALPEKLVDVDIMVNAKLQRLKAMLLNGEEFPTGYCLHQPMVALDDFVMVFSAFETFSEIAMAIQAGSPYGRTLYVGLANGCLCYLPTVEQLPYGGYEVDSFHANGGVTGFVDNTSELFTAGVIDLLKQMKENG